MNEQQIIQQITQLVDAAQNGDKQALKILQDTKTKAEQGDKQSIAIMQVVEQIMNQKQKAKHGTKLQYIKSLKNQCAEDEELYYYKKGGAVGCGCKKKEDGGPITKDNPSWKTKFENRKKNYPDPTEGGKKKYDPNTKKYVPVTEEDKKKWKKNLDDARKGKGEGTPERKCGGKVKKNEDGSKINKNCGGSAIAKFKMHRKGGSLNGIFFKK